MFLILIVIVLTMQLAKSSEVIVVFSFIMITVSVAGAAIISILLHFYWSILIALALIISFTFIIWSFRDPRRIISKNVQDILSPADGKISEMDKDDDEQLNVTILMSPFDVHMNRAPIDGVVKEVTFKKGSHWPVYFKKYSKRNQRNKIVIENSERGITAVVTQVSGIFARRTISYVQPGDKVEQGQKIGTIRFGSITHLVIKGEEKYIVKCNISDNVKAGLTILAKRTE